METLLETNIDLLRQSEKLLTSMDDARYRGTHPLVAPQRVGPQLRHILEFYECFLDGVPYGAIDYDARHRDPAIEASRETALRRIRTIIGRLVRTPALRRDTPLSVRMEDAPECVDPAFLPSSTGRELQVLASHTTHHFALIAMILRVQGHGVDANFGVAPSTLRHRAQAAVCAQ